MLQSLTNLITAGMIAKVGPAVIHFAFYALVFRYGLVYAERCINGFAGTSSVSTNNFFLNYAKRGPSVGLDRRQLIYKSLSSRVTN